jgi:hypothetical protein
VALRSSCRRTWLFGRSLPAADAPHPDRDRARVAAKALVLRRALMFEAGVVIASMPNQVDQEGE